MVNILLCDLCLLSLCASIAEVQYVKGEKKEMAASGGRWVARKLLSDKSLVGRCACSMDDSPFAACADRSLHRQAHAYTWCTRARKLSQVITSQKICEQKILQKWQRKE